MRLSACNRRRQFDESTAWETACEDWASDAAGLPTLHFDGFVDSVFELADLWTETVDIDEYLAFLHYAWPLTALQAMGLALTAFHDMSRRLNLGLKGGKLGYKSGQGD